MAPPRPLLAELAWAVFVVQLRRLLAVLASVSFVLQPELASTGVVSNKYHTHTHG